MIKHYQYSKQRYLSWLLTVPMKAMGMNSIYTASFMSPSQETVDDILGFEYVGVNYARATIPTVGRSIIQVSGGYSLVLPDFSLGAIPETELASGGIVIYADDGSLDLLFYDDQIWVPDGTVWLVQSDAGLGVIDVT